MTGAALLEGLQAFTRIAQPIFWLHSTAQAGRWRRLCLLRRSLAGT